MNMKKSKIIVLSSILAISLLTGVFVATRNNDDTMENSKTKTSESTKSMEKKSADTTNTIAINDTPVATETEDKEAVNQETQATETSTTPNEAVAVTNNNPQPTNSQQPAKAAEQPTQPVNNNPKPVSQAPAQAPAPAPQPKTGIYTPYSANLIANADSQPTVLFFHASWCPTCRAMEKDINDNINTLKASGIQVLKVDYDTATALKKQYQVTAQSSYVKVDKNGAKIKSTQGITKLNELTAFANSN
jgi:thiol-disulfide isomerase/thioredoxin